MKFEVKAEGVYYLSANIPLNKESIEYLNNEMNKENLNIARICLHDDEKSQLMSMIIMIKNKYTYPAHRHVWKDECYTIIQGSCRYYEYSPDGEALLSHYLDTGCTFLNKNKNFHTLVPSSDTLIFVESTIGPFQSQQLEFL